MNDINIQNNMKKFVDFWQGKGYEKGESQKFWLSLLSAYGVEHPEQYIDFENKVMMDHTSFIDGYIAKTKVLIEQKSIGKDLRAPIKQSDGMLLTPFQQAQRYMVNLPVSQHPKYVVTCNFSSFLVYDMEHPFQQPEEIFLENLETEYYRLKFLVDDKNAHLKKEMQVSMAAGELVGKLYDAFRKQYLEPDSEESLKSLNKLCVRLVFCLYAEDAGIFGEHGMFHDYLNAYPAKHLRKALIELFHVLDTKVEDRDKYMEESLAAFPYVNGGLFAEEDIEIPQFTEEIKNLLLEKASADFDWSEISPTIFGAVFESTLNPETRRKGGMHYTSIENIHKVIDPLFLDELKDELTLIKNEKVKKQRKQKLEAYQKKLAGLKFFDPACGSGNFLTESYLCLRRLENETIRLITGGEIILGELLNPIQVSIGQFYGIEINDFAVSVAKTALWIAESQMLKETESIVHLNLDFLPLKSFTNIVEGNALRLDWESVVPKAELNYIMGNPPFVGYSLQSKEQKADMLSVYVDENGKPYKTAGKIDYVAGWYFKAAKFMQGTSVRTAFVSTNSITQGEQVASVWKPLYERFGIHIDFAWRTFRWDSEASIKAHVHCVIIGFSCSKNSVVKRLYMNDDAIAKEVNDINPYLLNQKFLFIENIKFPLSANIPIMLSGNRPTDGGYLILSPEEKEQLLASEPNSQKFIKRFMMGYEFINNVPRYCLWLVNATPAELKQMPMVKKRILMCKEAREKSPDKGRQRLALTPMLFREQLNPKNFIAIPKVSSEQRKYIPMGFMNDEVIAGDKLFIVPDATIYHFGVLTSNVHMAWMRAVCGRLEMRYSYSINIVYNNFPWPSPTDAQKAKIEKTAQAILDARALYPDSSLADLYDEATMPSELRQAHRNNDRAVMEAYGMSVKDTTEESCVAKLMEMYQKLVSK